jgi:hypothetical protein
MANDDTPITAVQVFDSIRMSGHNTKKPLKTSTSGQFLMAFQSFLAQFVVFATKLGRFLLGNPTYILENATYVPCPQQDNGSVCGLLGHRHSASFD